MSVFWQNLWRRQKKKREGVSKNPWEKKANKNLSLSYKIATKIVPSDALTKNILSLHFQISVSHPVKWLKVHYFSLVWKNLRDKDQPTNGLHCVQRTQTKTLDKIPTIWGYQITAQFTGGVLLERTKPPESRADEDALL